MAQISCSPWMKSNTESSPSFDWSLFYNARFNGNKVVKMHWQHQHRHACACVSVFLWWLWHATNRCLSKHQCIDRCVKFLYFGAGCSEYVCVCVCVCVYAYTHTLHGEYFDEGPRIDTRQLEGQKNPDGIYLRIHISVYVYKVHMYLQYTGW